MKKPGYRLLSLMASAALVLAMAEIGSAQVTDSNKLSADVAMLNAESKLPRAEEIITDHLLDNFNVTPETIALLVGKNIKYGDMAAVLAFAETLPGGMSDDNINEVVKLHKSGAGWDQVATILAHRFGINTSEVAVTLSRIEDDARTSIELSIAESFAERAAPGAAAGGTGTTEATGGTGGSRK